MAISDLSNDHHQFKIPTAEKLSPKSLKAFAVMDKAANTKRASKPELLSPGGSLEKLRIAFLYGADAVYASGKDFGLRGFAHNLDTEELAAATVISRLLGKKIYITVNIFARQPDLKKIPPYLEYLQELKVDALIISDPGVVLLARKYAPEIPIHLSTQANTTNSSSVEFWAEQGVRRINLARELSFREIAEIAEEIKGRNRNICPRGYVHVLFGPLPDERLSQSARPPFGKGGSKCPASLAAKRGESECKQRLLHSTVQMVLGACRGKAPRRGFSGTGRWARNLYLQFERSVPARRDR